MSVRTKHMFSFTLQEQILAHADSSSVRSLFSSFFCYSPAHLSLLHAESFFLRSLSSSPAKIQPFQAPFRTFERLQDAFGQIRPLIHRFCRESDLQDVTSLGGMLAPWRPVENNVLYCSGLQVRVLLIQFTRS